MFEIETHLNWNVSRLPVYSKSVREWRKIELNSIKRAPIVNPINLWVLFVIETKIQYRYEFIIWYVLTNLLWIWLWITDLIVQLKHAMTTTWCIHISQNLLKTFLNNVWIFGCMYSRMTEMYLCRDCYHLYIKETGLVFSSTKNLDRFLCKHSLSEFNRLPQFEIAYSCTIIKIIDEVSQW